MDEMEEIEALAGGYSDARIDLTDFVQSLEAELDAVKRRHLAAIREAVRVAAEYRDDLRAAIEGAPELFSKPRTRVLHGIKVGYTKQPGKVVIDDEPATIERCQKLLPEEQAELLIRVRESIDKRAVCDLSAADLKRLGIAVTADTDAVVIKPTDGEVDKLVNALLAEIERIEDAA